MNDKIFITGYTGIGRALALKFANNGFDFALCRQNQSNIFPYPLDVTNRKTACFSKIIAKFKNIDISFSTGTWDQT